MLYCPFLSLNRLFGCKITTFMGINVQFLRKCVFYMIIFLLLCTRIIINKVNLCLIWRIIFL